MQRPSILRLALGSSRFFLGCVLLFIGTIFFTIVLPIGLAERRYAENGQTVMATIVSKHIRRATADTGTAYGVTYRLIGQNDAPADRSEVVDVAVWEAAEPGALVKVRHIPGDPSSARLDASNRQSSVLLWVFVGVGTLLVAPGAWLFLTGLSRVRDRLRLYRHGRQAEATVTGKRESNVTINRRRWWLVNYTYRDHTGQVHEASSDPMPRSEAADWTRGDTATVRYDADRPEHSVWVGR